jgi:hypothetical protein
MYTYIYVCMYLYVQPSCFVFPEDNAHHVLEPYFVKPIVLESSSYLSQAFFVFVRCNGRQLEP